MGNVLKEKCANGLLNDYLESVVSEIEILFQCRVSTFNMVLENEHGHCVVSSSKKED